jgi:hypothetical protein
VHNYKTSCIFSIYMFGRVNKNRLAKKRVPNFPLGVWVPQEHAQHQLLSPYILFMEH